MNSHIKLKILVIGESGGEICVYINEMSHKTMKYLCLVGKSSLMLRFTDDKFDKSEQPTIGVDFKVKHLEIDGQKIYLQIWVSSFTITPKFPHKFSPKHQTKIATLSSLPTGYRWSRKVQDINSIILQRCDRFE